MLEEITWQHRLIQSFTRLPYCLEQRHCTFTVSEGLGSRSWAVQTFSAVTTRNTFWFWYILTFGLFLWDHKGQKGDFPESCFCMDSFTDSSFHPTMGPYHRHLWLLLHEHSPNSPPLPCVRDSKTGGQQEFASCSFWYWRLIDIFLQEQRQIIELAILGHVRGNS